MIKIELTPADIHNLLAGLRMAIKHPETTDDDMLAFMILRQNIVGQANRPEMVVGESTTEEAPAPRMKRGDRRAKANGEPESAQ